MSETKKQTIPVVGMVCAACSANVEKRLNQLEGVKSASVSLPGRSALVEYDPDLVSLKKMKEEIGAIGYDMVIEQDRNANDIERQALHTLRNKVIIAWVISI